MIARPELQKSLGHHEHVVRLVMVVEARRVCQHSVAREDGHSIGCLFAGGQHAKDAFAAGDRQGFAAEFGDHVGRGRRRWGFQAGDFHLCRFVM